MQDETLTPKLIELRDRFILPNIPTEPVSAGQFIRCEFYRCTSPVQTEFSPGWTQYGESRFPDAPRRIANWCPKHSNASSYEQHAKQIRGPQ